MNPKVSFLTSLAKKPNAGRLHVLVLQPKGPTAAIERCAQMSQLDPSVSLHYIKLGDLSS